MDPHDDDDEYIDIDPLAPSTSTAATQSSKRRRVESGRKTTQKYKPLSAFDTPKWTKRSNREGQFEYNIAPEPQPLNELQNDLVNNLKEKSAIELFKLFFDAEVLTMIIDETNRYAQQKNSNFLLHERDLKRFLGILVLSGYHTVPSVRDYWSNNPTLGVDIVKQCMSRNRFLDIKRYIHFSNNFNLDKDDKMAKVYFLRFQI